MDGWIWPGTDGGVDPGLLRPNIRMRGEYMKRRIFAIAVALCMLLALLPAGAMAAGTAGTP